MNTQELRQRIEHCFKQPDPAGKVEAFCLELIQHGAKLGQASMRARMANNSTLAAEVLESIFPNVEIKL